MKEIEIEGEVLYLHKGFFGWKIVKPIKSKDGSYIWKNLIAGGNWFNLLFIAILVIVIVGSIFEYTNAVRIANECLAQNQLYGLLN